MSRMIPIAGPSISKKEIAYVTDAIENGWYENANDYIKRFEESFKSYVGRKYAIALPSCTSALHLSLLALNIGPGDEVIVQENTWIASIAAVCYLGATPRFADIDPLNWCLSLATIKPLINENTKAIVSVNLYGHMPDYDELYTLGIPIIEDAAESTGSSFKGRLSGSFGVTSCFSFHGSKTLVTGEGGMLVTDNQEVYERCQILKDHGRHPGDTLFQNFEIGYKYKMSNLQAAVGLAQLERIEELVEKKRMIFSWYSEVFKGTNYLTLNPSSPQLRNSYWMTTVLFENSEFIEQKVLIKELRDSGVDTRPFFSPLSSLKAFKDAQDIKRAQRENIYAYEISARGINLPSHQNLTYEDVCLVKKKLDKIVSQKLLSPQMSL